MRAEPRHLCGPGGRIRAKDDEYQVGQDIEGQTKPVPRMVYAHDDTAFQRRSIHVEEVLPNWMSYLEVRPSGA